jgi:hypothetical protein
VSTISQFPNGWYTGKTWRRTRLHGKTRRSYRRRSLGSSPDVLS